jgi:NAD(P)H-nitrite reductase large subunit
MAARHVIVGAGPAAVSAAQAIRSQDAGAEILLVSEDPHGYYSRPGLAYYLLNQVPASLLSPVKPEEFARQGITIARDTVTSVHPSERRVVFAKGKDLAYDRLLLATGATAIPLDVPGADLDGVVKLDDMHDARNILARCVKGLSAVVVGGGATAVEIAEGLRTQKVHVHYLMSDERYWPDVLSEAESRIIERRLAARTLQLHPRTKIARIVGSDGRVAGVATEDGTHIPCGMVAVAVGVSPNIGLAEAAGLVCRRGVLVDEHMATSDPSIYAAGDVAETDAAATGRGTIETLWNSAVNEGRVAGLNMVTGPTHRYVDDVALNVTRIAGLKCTIVGAVGHGLGGDLKGLARGDSEVWRRSEDASIVEFEGDHTHVRLALSDTKIVGAVIIGVQTLAVPLQELVAARADVGAVINRLQTPDHSTVDLIEEFWQQWRTASV